DLNFASKKGVELGVIDHLQFIVDGDGSTFPIIEEERPGKSLWQLVMKWNDVSADPFDVEYIRVEMNKSHYMYDYMFKDTKPSAFLLSEIMSNVMAQVIYKAVNDDSFTDSPDDTESIANVVSYWISTYEIDITSLENISYTLRNNLEGIKYSISTAENNFEQLNANTFPNFEVNKKYTELRNDLIEIRDKVFDVHNFDNVEKLGYNFDLTYGLELYDLLNNKYNFKMR